MWISFDRLHVRNYGDVIHMSANILHHVDLKLGVLRHLRDMFHARALTNEVLPIELLTVANDLQTPIERVQGAVAELIALGLARPNAGAPPHTAVVDGRAEITEAGLGHLHHAEAERATALFNADIAVENIRLQARLQAEAAEVQREASLEIPSPRSSLKRAGFHADEDR